MFSVPYQRSQVIQPHSYHQHHPAQALAISADRLAPARDVAVGTLLNAALWASGIGFVLRFLG